MCENVCVWLCVFLCVYEAVRLAGYTLSCGSECASKTTPPVDRTQLVMAARMIAFHFPCLVFRYGAVDAMPVSHVGD